MLWIILAYLLGHHSPEYVQGARVWLVAHYPKLFKLLKLLSRQKKRSATEQPSSHRLLQYACTWVLPGDKRFDWRNEFFVREGGGVRIGVYVNKNQMAQIIGEHAQLLCIPTGLCEGAEVLLALDANNCIQAVYGYRGTQGSMLQKYPLQVSLSHAELLGARGLRSNEIAVQVRQEDDAVSSVYVIRLRAEKALVVSVDDIPLRSLEQLNNTVLVSTLGNQPVLVTDNGVVNQPRIEVAQIRHMTGGLYVSTYWILDQCCLRVLEKGTDGTYSNRGTFLPRFSTDTLPGWVGLGCGDGEPVIDNKGVAYIVVIAPDETVLLCPGTPEISDDIIIYQDRHGEVSTLWCLPELHEWKHSSQDKPGWSSKGTAYSAWKQGIIYIERGPNGCHLIDRTNQGVTHNHSIVDNGPDSDIETILRHGYWLGWAPVVVSASEV